MFMHFMPNWRREGYLLCGPAAAAAASGVEVVTVPSTANGAVAVGQLREKLREREGKLGEKAEQKEQRERERDQTPSERHPVQSAPRESGARIKETPFCACAESGDCGQQ